MFCNYKHNIIEILMKIFVDLTHLLSNTEIHNALSKY